MCVCAVFPSSSHCALSACLSVDAEGFPPFSSDLIAQIAVNMFKNVAERGAWGTAFNSAFQSYEVCSQMRVKLFTSPSVEPRLLFLIH